MRFDSLSGRILRLPLRFIPRTTNMIVWSGINRGYRWKVGSASHGCWLGWYESMVQRQLPTLVRPGMTCFDVGANVGFYTLALSRLVGSSGQVVAFEPLAENAADLRHHVVLNELSQVSVMELAVTDFDGTAAFEKNVSRLMGRLNPNADSNVMVSTVRLDSLIESKRAPAPDFVKMDIEGEEVRALHGSEEILGRFHPTMLIALHGEKLFAEAIQLLHRHHYHVRDLNNRMLRDDDPAVGEIVAIHPSRES